MTARFRRGRRADTRVVLKSMSPRYNKDGVHPFLSYFFVFLPFGVASLVETWVSMRLCNRRRKTMVSGMRIVIAVSPKGRGKEEREKEGTVGLLYDVLCRRERSFRGTLIVTSQRAVRCGISALSCQSLPLLFLLSMLPDIS